MQNNQTSLRSTFQLGISLKLYKAVKFICQIHCSIFSQELFLTAGIKTSNDFPIGFADATSPGWHGACVITGRGAIRGHRVGHYRSSECGGFGGGKSGVTSIRGFSSLLPRPPLCAPEKDDPKVWGRPPAPTRLDICHLQVYLILLTKPAWL